MVNKYFTNIPEYDGIGVYALINNRTGEMYIGSSQNVHKRIMQHKLSPSKAIEKAVESGDTFCVKILEKLPSGSNQFDMCEREKYFIDLYDTINHGYNKASTTCCSKEELLETLQLFKSGSAMANYILNIIAKRERPIYIHEKENYDRINVTFPKGRKEEIREHATAHGESVNAFIIRAVSETMAREIEK